MKKIKKLTITNFQNHAQTVLEFDPNITCIIGPSDSGKSAIIRSLLCALYRDKFYLSNWATKGSILLSFDDSIFERTYELRNKVITEKFILDGSKFAKIGRELPDEIKNVFHIEPIDYGEGLEVNYNVHQQHDNKFLLTQSAGDKTKVTSLRGLLIIDNLSILASQKGKRLRASLKEIEDANEKVSNELEAVKKELDSLPYDLNLRVKNVKQKIQLFMLYKKLSKMEEPRIKYVTIPLKLIDNLRVLQLLKRLQLHQTKLPIDKKIDLNIKEHIRKIRHNIGMWNLCRDLANARANVYKTLSDIATKQYNIITAKNALNDFKKDNPNCPLCSNPWNQ